MALAALTVVGAVVFGLVTAGGDSAPVTSASPSATPSAGPTASPSADPASFVSADGQDLMLTASSSATQAPTPTR